jgi:hypothetical protein
MKALRTQKSTSKFPLPPNSRSPTWNVTVILSSLCSASWKHSRWWAFIWMLCEAASEMKLLAAAKTAREGNSMIGVVLCCRVGVSRRRVWELAMRKWPGCPQCCRGRRNGLCAGMFERRLNPFWNNLKTIMLSLCSESNRSLNGWLIWVSSSKTSSGLQPLFSHVVVIGFLNAFSLLCHLILALLVLSTLTLQNHFPVVMPYFDL